jgi:hypothetical protein
LKRSESKNKSASVETKMGSVKQIDQEIKKSSKEADGEKVGEKAGEKITSKEKVQSGAVISSSSSSSSFLYLIVQIQMDLFSILLYYFI